MKVVSRDWVWKGWQVRYGFSIGDTCDPNNIPMLLIHGFGASSNQWHHSVQSLGHHHPVYTIDLVGFGESQKVAASYNVALWTEQVYEFWRSFIGRPSVVVGHSLGALVSATLASEFPEAVKALVLMTLPATRQEQLSSAWAQNLVSFVEKSVANPLLIRLIFNIARQRRVIRSALKASYSNQSYVTDSVIDSFVKPTLDRGAAQTLCRLTQAATTTSYSKSRSMLLSQVKQPILLMWAEDDRITPIAQSQNLHQEFPTITWKPIPNAGHCFYDECADIINPLMTSWIKAQVL
ncbi:MAG: alpha/beta fold hydrolase [Cyanobacteria bacterium J06626_14]